MNLIIFLFSKNDIIDIRELLKNDEQKDCIDQITIFKDGFDFDLKLQVNKAPNNELTLINEQNLIKEDSIKVKSNINHGDANKFNELFQKSLELNKIDESKTLVTEKTTEDLNLIPVKERIPLNQVLFKYLSDDNIVMNLVSQNINMLKTLFNTGNSIGRKLSIYCDIIESVREQMKKLKNFNTIMQIV